MAFPSKGFLIPTWMKGEKQFLKLSENPRESVNYSKLVSGPTPSLKKSHLFHSSFSTDTLAAMNEISPSK